MTLHALRLTVGNDAFFKILRQWADRNLNAPAATADFRTLAEQISGVDLDGFFDEWLVDTDKPPAPPGPDSAAAAVARTAATANTVEGASNAPLADAPGPNAGSTIGAAMPHGRR